MDLPVTLLAIIGIVTLLVGLIRLSAYVHHYGFYKFSYNKYKGDWAVVTGASGGIGAAMVVALAKRGINVILLARNESKMEEICKRCEADYNVKAKSIKFDFSTATSSDYNDLISKLVAEYNPTILVNNVGINVEMPTDFVQLDSEDDPEQVSNMVRVNVFPTNKMTHGLLPSMISKARGVILFLSSAGGVVTPAPMLAPYAGTKAYNDSFAVSLSGEVSVSGIHVHSLTPFFVESAMAKMRSSFTVPTAEKFADLSLNLVGSPYPRLQPYWVHFIMQLAVTSLPQFMQVKFVNNLHRSIRKRALRKKEKLAKQALAAKNSS